ncbi:hypothetical protein [Parachryseolinea silvisoli]|uniref:hypothetical protein n=1 Tax=Parachryseolinea silvisoli TaxID=2873601 RepID=UPI002265F618|nr:hypothetical protein [Parachryseolinea silvisoli]MCD9017912.1 hypothetical protein [Parachryseolinea silvisoli]
MGLFYTASPKEMTDIRKKIFLEAGLPALEKQGFVRSPFSTDWFGWYPNTGYSYQLCRLTEGSVLESVSVDIIRGDCWIQVHLNIFKLQPHIASLEQLANLDGLKFHLPPNSISSMRLRSDDVVGPPILDYHYMFRNHKIGSYYTKRGLARNGERLREIIGSDLADIDYFVKRWHQKHRVVATTWEGAPIPG